MDYPKTLSIYSEILEKPLDAFTLEDWRTVAIFACRQLEKALFPPKKKRGPSKRKKDLTLLDLVDLPQRKQRTAKAKRYGKKRWASIDRISNLLDQLLAPETKSQYGDRAPLTKKAAMERILRALGLPEEYAESLLRAVRRFRRTKKQK